MSTSLPPKTRRSPNGSDAPSTKPLRPRPLAASGQHAVPAVAVSTGSTETRFRVVTAGPGDHTSVFALLNRVLQAPSSSEFQAQLEQPFYEPANRLVVRRGEEVIAHVRNSNRELQFGHSILPVTYVSELAIAREHRGQGIADALIAGAQLRAKAEGAVLLVTRTTSPRLFEQQGWTPCISHCLSTAGPRDLLAHLNVTGQTNSTDFSEWTARLEPGYSPRSRLNIRLWRHVEQAALTRLYSENTPLTYGPIVRRDDYWRWLLSRHGCDRIYIAIEGPDKLDLDDSLEPIVAYAAMKEGRIVELMVSPNRPDAASQLLARACGDAIERDHHSVRLDAAPGHPLHQVFALAGGVHVCRETVGGETIMAKLLDPIGFLESLCGALHERAKAASLPRPTELGLSLGGNRYQLVISRRSVRLETGRLGRSYLDCNVDQLTQLLLGHLNVRQAVKAERLHASTQVATESATILFPKLPFWLPPLDELPAE